MSSNSTQNTPSGIVYNVLASGLFAVMYAYTSLLEPLTGEEIFGWRILLTIPCMTLLVVITGHWHEIGKLVRRLSREHFFWAHRLLSAALFSIQLWLFMWAPINGYGLDVSLGYFLLPITMVLLGRFAFNDRLTRLQLIACTLAVIGITYQFVIAQKLTWPTMMVCLGYPAYFWLRRRTQTNTLGSTWLDMVLALPVSLYFVLQHGQLLPSGAPPALPWLILGLGVISALALGLQALSTPRLNLTIFGLLIYVEPVLLVVAALLLGETIEPSMWPTYIAIWLAVVVLIVEGVQAIRSSHRTRKKRRHKGLGAQR